MDQHRTVIVSRWVGSVKQLDHTNPTLLIQHSFPVPQSLRMSSDDGLLVVRGFPDSSPPDERYVVRFVGLSPVRGGGTLCASSERHG